MRRGPGTGRASVRAPDGRGAPAPGAARPSAADDAGAGRRRRRSDRVRVERARAVRHEGEGRRPLGLPGGEPADAAARAPKGALGPLQARRLGAGEPPALPGAPRERRPRVEELRASRGHHQSIAGAGAGSNYIKDLAPADADVGGATESAGPALATPLPPRPLSASCCCCGGGARELMRSCVKVVVAPKEELASPPPPPSLSEEGKSAEASVSGPGLASPAPVKSDSAAERGGSARRRR